MPRPKVRETGNEDMHDDLYDKEEELADIVKVCRPNFKSTVNLKKLDQMVVLVDDTDAYIHQGLKEIDKMFKDGES